MLAKIEARFKAVTDAGVPSYMINMGDIFMSLVRPKFSLISTLSTLLPPNLTNTVGSVYQLVWLEPFGPKTDYLFNIWILF